MVFHRGYPCGLRRRDGFADGIGFSRIFQHLGARIWLYRQRCGCRLHELRGPAAHAELSFAPLMGELVVGTKGEHRAVIIDYQNQE